MVRWNPVADLPDHTEPALNRVVTNQELPGAAAKHRPFYVPKNLTEASPQTTRIWNLLRVTSLLRHTDSFPLAFPAEAN